MKKVDSEILKYTLNADVKLNQMFRPYALKMEAAGQHPIVVNLFKTYYGQLLCGEQGKFPEDQILPVLPGDIPEYDDLEEYVKKGREALSKTVVVKLNGGLGTSMGMNSPKSLIPVRDGKTFLDFTLEHIRFLRKEYNIEVPFSLMNSFKTHMETMLSLQGFDNGKSYINVAFLQHKYPKILQSSFEPSVWEANPELEWNPPGHGDVYAAFVTSNMLSKMLSKGYRYAFISNVDNLGATVDLRILGYMYEQKIPFLMEVADRAEADKKGGHLMRLRSKNRLALREIAQCPEEELGDFFDIKKYCFFNTNSIWLDLQAFEEVFLHHHSMPLDLIINPKTVDPRDENSPKVFQLETAMGSAISAFQNAMAVRVPRTRFSPVKITADLLLIMSDCYIEIDRQTLMLNPQRKLPLPLISLDNRFYKKIDDFELRFPEGVPSLLECKSLQVEGDIVFGRGVVLRGDVQLENRSGKQVYLQAEQVVSGKMEWI